MSVEPLHVRVRKFLRWRMNLSAEEAEALIAHALEGVVDSVEELQLPGRFYDPYEHAAFVAGVIHAMHVARTNAERGKTDGDS